MADVDPLTAVPLEAGERVLWHGRPPLGAEWPGPTALAWAGLRVWLLLLAVTAGPCVVTAIAIALAGGGGDATLVFAQLVLMIAVAEAVIVAIPLVVIAASKRVGPFYGAIFALGLWGPSFAIFWAGLVAAHGWSGALTRLFAEDDAVAAVVFVGLPLARLAHGVTRRLALVHVITDRRVLELRGARVVWERSRDDLRVERTWRSPGGHLVVGTGATRRELHVRDDPARVLDDVRPLAPPG